MSLSVRILGTSAARPTVERGVSSIAVIREGETLLFDCGEGTQRQMMRYGISFALNDIFFTHRMLRIFPCPIAHDRTVPGAALGFHRAS